MLLRTTTLHIAGMRGPRCAQLVRTALAGAEGARGATVAVGRADVEHDAATTTDALVRAVESVGYAVTRVERGAPGLPLL